MTVSDTNPTLAASDVGAAIGLLTRIPVRVDMDRATARGAKAAWAYPIAGLIVGFLVGIVGIGASLLGVPAQLAAALGLAVGIIVTGAMHEDGLADTADGLWGGWDPEGRLKIMKDSYIGAYGVIAIVLSLLIRWMILTTLIDADGGLWMIIAIAALSRTAMVVLMTWLPNARTGGLSRAVGRPDKMTAVIAAAIGGGFAIISLGGTIIIAAGITVLATLGCGIIARAKIGGQTGDILGATQQICEMGLGIGLICALAL